MDLKQAGPRTRSRDVRVAKDKPSPRSPHALSNVQEKPEQRHHSFGGFSMDSKKSEPGTASTDSSAAKPAPQRRASSFASPSSPWARRRSFLSSSMMGNEKHLVYELSASRAYGLDTSNVPTFSISLRESQGFAWNQDLFASQYQQESGVIYDDGGDSADEDAVADDDDEMADDAYYDEYEARRRRRFSSGRRAYSYSMSHSEGAVQKVKVIDVTVDDDE